MSSDNYGRHDGRAFEEQYCGLCGQKLLHHNIGKSVCADCEEQERREIDEIAKAEARAERALEEGRW